MAFPQQHQYMTVIGDCYGGRETWQFGLRLTDGGVSNQETALALADVVRNFWVGDVPPYSTGDALNPVSTHRLTELKVARLDVNGKYPGQETAYSHFFLPAIPGVGVPIQGTVPQSTACVTLMTAVPRGLASKGRIFLPPTRHMDISTTDGLMAVASAKALANCVSTFIKAINAQTLVGNVAIFSRGKGLAEWHPTTHKVTYTYPTAGAVNNVVSTRCGRVVDTQRRRRRSLGESPSVNTV